MPIQKFGTSGKEGVTGIEHAPITREAARDDADLDQALQQENAEADSPEGND